MKKTWILFSFILLLSVNLHSQSLRSLRNKLEDAMIDKVVDDVVNDSDSKNTNSNTSSSDNSSDNSLDDVPDALAQASTEFNGKEYRSARASLHKALRTLEIKLGEQLIASLPENVQSLSVKSDADKVATGSETWTGLTVHREYEKNDTWAAITIYNGSASSLASTAVYSGMYASYSGEDENQKHITIKGKDAVITYSDSEGYSIGISVGQQTFAVIEGVNVGSEAEMKAIAESFDYEAIKKTLGDQ